VGGWVDLVILRRVDIRSLIMKNIFFIALAVLISCEDKEIESYKVLVKVARRNINVYGFGILVNGNHVFQATECGSSNLSTEQCVDFNDPFLGSYAYNYEFSAKKGDKIGVLVNPEDGCYSSVSAWIYVDNDLKESVVDPCEDEDCNDCCCSLIGCDYTI
jgi:hypothetical protein